VGGLGLALTVMLAVAAVTMTRPVVLTALTGYRVYAATHFAFHVTHFEHFELRDAVSVGTGLGIEVVLGEARLHAVADPELQDRDLVGELGPLLQAIERVHERLDLLAPERGVRAVGHAAGQGRRVVLLEGLVPGGEVAPVGAVEGPDDALGRAHPLLEVDALVDVGDDAQGLGEAVDDLLDEDGARHVLVTGSLVEVDVHPLQLEVAGTIVHAGSIETMLARDGLPERGTNLVTTLAGLDVQNLTHIACVRSR